MNIFYLIAKDIKSTKKTWTMKENLIRFNKIYNTQ